MTALRYDGEADAAYVTIGGPVGDGESARTVPVALPDGIRGEVLLDFDLDGRLLGVEILRASRMLREGVVSGA